MKKTIDSLFRALVILVLFPFLFVAGPGIIGSEDLDPDDGLGLFDIPKILTVSVTPGRFNQSISSLSDFCPASLSSQGHQSWSTSLLLFIADLTSPVTLRC
jgi:hypothetical protein